MDKAEWDAKDNIERNQVTWNHFPDITPDSDDWVLSADGGETGFDFFGSEEEATNAMPKYAALMAEEPEREMTVVHWRHCRKFTTDRNACALVLDEIEKKGLIEDYLACLTETLFGCPGRDFESWAALMAVHNADPGTICYCAVKAVENATE